MKKTLFLIFALLLITAVKAQDFRDYYTIANDGSRVELNISDILDSDMRYCLLSAIVGDNNISYTLDEDKISVNVAYKNNDFSESFSDYLDRITDKLNEEYSEYLKADKETKGDIFLRWKESLPEDMFVFLFRLMLIETPASRDDNQTCATSDPFCTTDVVTFHVEANPGGSCENGPYYGCLDPYTERPPFWFHMKIGVAGAFTIKMTNSANVDIDYCCWGPFDDPVTPCPAQLTQAKYIDCGSSGSATENCHIPSTSQVGKYYIMVITKYNQSTATDITFQKVAGSGPGETDCGILPPLVENDGPYCVGETIHLSGNAQAGASYSWSGPGGWSATGQNVTRPNCTLAMAGTYTCTITLGSQSNSAASEVAVYAQPTANFNAFTVCEGETTQFTSTSTTNPAGQQITSYLWNFGDGQTSTQQNPTHTYANPGDYTATLTVACGDNTCTNTKTKTVTVNSQPVANAGNDSNVNFNNPATLSATAVLGATYAWQPAEKINGNPNQQTVQTVPLQETTTFTLTVTKSGCSDSDQVTISVGAQMTASATIQDAEICDGNTTSVTATAHGGNGPGSYTYSWESSRPATFSNPNAPSTNVAPQEPGEYVLTCVVNDGQTTMRPQVNLTVNPAENMDITEAVCPSELPYILELPDGTTQSFTEGTGASGWHATVQNQYGCNVNVSLYLTVNAVVENEYTYETCNEPFTFIDNGQVIKVLDHTCVFDTIYPYGECEKHAIIHFTRHSVYDENYQGEYVADNYPEHHCDTYTWPSNGKTYDQRGDYRWTFESIHGCDSIVTLHLDENNLSFTVDLGPNSAQAVDTCKSLDGYYLWGAEQIWASNSDTPYSQIFANASTEGCDSIGYLNIRLYERPNIETLYGDQLVQPGAVFMPYVYEYSLLDITGAGIDNGDYPVEPDDYLWEVLSYYNTPNRLHPSTDNYESTWQIGYPDSNNLSHIYLYVNAEGNAVLKCTIQTLCGPVSKEKFIYTAGYQNGEAVDEYNYEDMVNIFPNPTNGDIYIGYSQLLTAEPLIISIYSYNGALIDQFYGSNDSTVIQYSMGDMPNGLYLVRFIGSDFVVTKKFVLSR